MCESHHVLLIPYHTYIRQNFPGSMSDMTHMNNIDHTEADLQPT